MRDEKIRLAGVWIAGGGGIWAIVGLVFPGLRPTLLPATVIVVCTLVTLFLRVLFSRLYRYEIQHLNWELRRDDPWPGKFKKLSDAEWGLLGSRAGGKVLLFVRAVLFVGAMPLAIAEAWVGKEVVRLWWAAFFLSLILSLMHAAIVSDRAP